MSPLTQLCTGLGGAQGQSISRDDSSRPTRVAVGLACYVDARWDMPDGDKEIRPLIVRDGRWRPKGIVEGVTKRLSELSHFSEVVQRPQHLRDITVRYPC